MRHCAFLTAENLDGFVTDDELARQPLLDRGWEMTFVPWSRPGVDWSRFEAVVIRSTWDYHRRLDEFLAALETIDRSRFSTPVPGSRIRWKSCAGTSGRPTCASWRLKASPSCRPSGPRAPT